MVKQSENAGCCCGPLDCKTTETANGVRIELSAKDASKKKSLKTLLKAMRDFCGCC